MSQNFPRTTDSVDRGSSESSPGGPFEPDTVLLERIAAGESVRALAREIGLAHTTLLRSLKRPRVASELRAAERRLSAERADERRAENEVRRRARQQAGRGRQLDGLSTGCYSQNDEVALEVVAAGGGVQELIEATGLPTRLNVYESIDSQVVDRALDNDDRRSPGAGESRRFVPDPALIARRAAGESLRSLAPGSGVSAATLSRAFARPEVAEEVRLQELKLQEHQSNEDQRRTALIADYTSKISDVWCPVHRRRTYVRNVETSGSETRLAVAGCCDEAIQELMRWLKIHRAVLPNGDTFTPAGHAPPNATVPPA